MKNTRKKSVVVLLGLAITGLVGASAASLGGITTSGVGADTAFVGSCDTTGVVADFATAFEGPFMEIDTVSVSSVALACNTLDYAVTLTDGGVELGTVTGPVILGGTLVDTFVVDFSANNIDANLVDGIAISISG